MANLSDIIKARLIDGEKLPSWYKDRLELCLGCEHNTLNKEKLTIKEKAAHLLNTEFGACSICFCTTNQKTKLETEECSQNPPKWTSINIDRKKHTPLNSLDYKLSNLSPEKVNLQFANQEYLLDYGTIKYMSDTDIKVLVEPTTEFKNLSISSSCGCTTPKLIRKEDNIEITIGYDSKRLGSFSKVVTLGYTSDNLKKAIRIRITGTVTKLPIQ